MSGVTQRKKGGKPVGDVAFDGEDGLYDRTADGPANELPYWLRPLNANSSFWITVVSLFWELSATALFVFFTILAFSGNTAETNRVLAGLLVGLISGGTLYLVFGLHSKQDKIPRHVMWTVTAFHMVLLKTGLLAGLILMAVQTIGALIAAGFLWWIGVADTVLASYPAGQPLIIDWFIEVLAVAVGLLVYFAYHLHGTSRAEVEDQRRDAQFYFAASRAAFTAVLLQRGLYSFEPLVYLGGLVATCTGGVCTTEAPFGAAPAFFLLVPFLGVAIAALIAIIALAMNGVEEIRKRRNGGSAAANAEQRISKKISSGHDELDVPFE